MQYCEILEAKFKQKCKINGEQAKNRPDSAVFAKRPITNGRSEMVSLPLLQNPKNA